MSDHGEMVVVRVGLDIPHLRDGEFDVGDAALDLRQAADKDLADLGHHRRVGRQIVLNADHDIAARGHQVCEEGIFGVLDGVAVIEDRNRQLQHAGIGLHLPVAANGDIDRDRTVVALGIIERDRLMTDCPLAGREIPHDHQRAD